MITDSLASLVDKVIGKTGQLRSPAWWMHRIFSKVGEELTELKDKVAALIPKVGANSDYIDTITPLIDSYFSQPIEFEATHKGTVEYKYGNLYGKGDWVNKETANTTAETTEKLKFYGNINFSADDSSYNTTLISLALPNGTLFVQPKKMFYGRVRLATLVLPECVKLGKDVSEMFSCCSALTTLDVSGWDTSKVTDMNHMFYDCSALTTLDVSGFDTSKVTDMGFMFGSCSKLTTLDVSGFDTSKVTNMDSMFYSCSALTTLDLSGFDTSKVTNMDSMFYYCSKLTTLDVSGWDTSKVTDMGYMFYNCSALTTLDLSGFDTSKVTNMDSMFYYCSKLTTLDVSGWDTSKVTIMNSMFYNCSKLTTLDVSGFDTSKVTDMGSMFYNCSALTTLDVSGFDTSKVTNMDSMFYDCSALTTLDVSGFDTSKVTDMGYMFYNCLALTTVTGTITGIKESLDLRYNPLTNASAMVFINGLAEVTTAKTITFKATTYATLTEEQIAVATSKGWTVASA